MSSDRGDYIATIERFYVSFLGRGLMLSPRDEAVADAWYEAGIPLRAVERGLEEGAEAANRRKPGSVRSLKFFSPFIDSAHRQYAERLLGNEQTSFPSQPASDSAAQEALERRAERNARDATILKPFIERLKACEPEGLWEELPRLDAEIADSFYLVMSPVERATMDAALSNHIATQRKTGLSQDALAAERSLFRDRYVRTHFDVPELVAVALED